MVILNTCHIREKATEKVYSELGRLRVLKNEKEKPAAACWWRWRAAPRQAEGEEIMARAPVVDHGGGAAILSSPAGNDRPHRPRRGRMCWRPIFPRWKNSTALPEAVSRHRRQRLSHGAGRLRQILHLLRGALHREARNIPARPNEFWPRRGRLSARGAREIVLLGQNVNAYRGADAKGKVWTLARLIEALAEIKDVSRIRYTTSHPRDMGDDLIAAHGGIEKLMPFLHLPVQSGSDTVLAAMNRQHTADDYRRLIGRMRAARPDMAFSSDFIVGFPGESDADFEATMRLVREVGFAQCFLSNTARAPARRRRRHKKQVAESVKTSRLEILQKLLLAQQDQANNAVIGKTMPSAV